MRSDKVMFAGKAVDNVQSGDKLLEMRIPGRATDRFQSLCLAGAFAVITLQTVVEPEHGDDHEDDQRQYTHDEQHRTQRLRKGLEGLLYVP